MFHNSAPSRLIAAAAVLLVGLAGAATSVDSTILIIGRNDANVAKASSGLDDYAIPWEKALIAQGGSELPPLNASTAEGRLGGIVVIGSVSYGANETSRINGTRFSSALSDKQWGDLYTYQKAFHVRMVRLDEFPGPSFGASTAIANRSCCGSGQEQLISLDSTDAFPVANLKTGAGMSTKGLWHHPVSVSDAATTKAFASFEPAGDFSVKSVAAVVSNFNGRSQMAWFITWAPDWSATSNFLQHAYIYWMTRSLFVGKRKVHLSPQVDDVHLDTELYRPQGSSFRLRTGDLDAHVDWQIRLNARLPAGSDVRLELGHNGNGDIIKAVEKPQGASLCRPPVAVDYTSPPDKSLEFMKPPGSGINLWPSNFTQYSWSLDCDNTRDVLRNRQNRFWPLATTVETNGREGIWIVPRFATTIYYNCDKPDCTLQEWKDTSAGQGDFQNLLADARATNSRYLLGLQADPYMFHQANMRQTDMDALTVGSESGKMSLLMTWVETVAQEMMRLTFWPMTSFKHDELARYFLDCMTLDACKPRASYSYSADGSAIKFITVTTDGNSCNVPVPVTVPGGDASADGGSARTDKVGGEPLIMWITASNDAC